MLRLLRSPWLAALLLLASPGVAGVVLPMLHPCAAEAGGTGHPSSTGMGQHGGAHGHDSAPGGHDDSEGACTCLGSCHVPVVVEPPNDGSPVRVTLSDPHGRSAVAPPVLAPPSHPTLALLPPKTAPPLA